MPTNTSNTALQRSLFLPWSDLLSGGDNWLYGLSEDELAKSLQYITFMNYLIRNTLEMSYNTWEKQD